MTTYYVRKSGNDANSGLSSVSAKRTIQAAVNLFSLNGTDKAYVGQGVYPEEMFFYRNGAGIGSEHQVVGDIFGEFTGDAPGPVRVTASNDNDMALRSGVVVPMANHIKISRLILHGGRAPDSGDFAAVFLASQAGRAVSNFVVEDSLVDPAGMRQIAYYRADGSSGRDGEIEFRRSVVRGYVNRHGFFDDGNGTHVWRIRAYSTAFMEAVGEDTDTALIFNNGPETIHFAADKCYFGPPKNAIIRHFNGLTSVSIHNSVFRLGDKPYDADGGTFEDDRSHNVFEGSSVPSLGTGEVQRWSGDLMLWALLKDFRIYQALNSDSGLSTSLTYDALGRTVPQGVGTDFGVGENQDYPEKDTSTFSGTAPSMRSPSGRRILERVFWGLRSQSNTFFVQCRYNSSYTATPKPRITVKADPALGIGSDAFSEAGTGSLNAFSLLSVSVTANADGVAEIWLETFSSQSGAQAWFDAFSGPGFSG